MKLKLNDLKVESFVTSAEDGESATPQYKGGAIITYYNSCFCPQPTAFACSQLDCPSQGCPSFQGVCPSLVDGCPSALFCP